MTPKVKICGLSQLADVAAVNACAPDYVGLVFWSHSKRCVSEEEAACLRGALDARIGVVGVFVDADVEQIARLHARDVISVAQLHGNEDDAYLARLRACAPGLAIWKAFEVDASGAPAEGAGGKPVVRAGGAGAGCLVGASGAPASALAVIERANASAADLVLLDAGKGEGRAFDWSVLASIERPFALAGGLDACNVSAALSACAPAVVDVSSGVEAGRAPDGRPRKDAARMREFTRAVRACRSNASCCEPRSER